MMIGHYGTALAAKALDKRLSLGVLFIACQLVDVIWAVLVLTGVEQVQLTPGFTASNPLDLRYIPYTHSLTAALGWGLLTVLGWNALRGWRGWQGSALLLGAVVAGHWFCDWLVHIPDLPLYGDEHKVGLGLWQHRYPALALEAGIFFGALALYYRRTERRTPGGRYGIAVLAVAMFGIQVGALFGPLPKNSIELGATGLLSFVGLALIAGWLDRKRC